MDQGGEDQKYFVDHDGLDENDDQNHIRAETRTPGLSRKSNSTLSLVNDVDMEVVADCPMLITDCPLMSFETCGWKLQTILPPSHYLHITFQMI